MQRSTALRLQLEQTTARFELEKQARLRLEAELAGAEDALTAAVAKAEAAYSSASEFAADADTLREALVLAAEDMGVMETVLARAGISPSEFRQTGEKTLYSCFKRCAPTLSR